MSLNITDAKDVSVWHMGEPLPAREDIVGSVVVFAADGDELEWLLHQIGVRRRQPPGTKTIRLRSGRELADCALTGSNAPVAIDGLIIIRLVARDWAMMLSQYLRAPGRLLP
jgi:hypothetical protein